MPAGIITLPKAPPEPKRNNDYAALAPNFAACLHLIYADMVKAGMNAALFEGRRTNQRQIWLYGSGRSYRGGWLTNASTAEHSWHYYGLAGDTAFLIKGDWSWEVKDSWWAKLQEIAKKYECITGRSWHSADAPHIQPANLKQSPSPLAIRLYAQGGVEAVWKATGHDRVHILNAVHA